VGYWIRAKKLHAERLGRNYKVPVDDLLFFLKNNGHPIPPELAQKNLNRPVFKSFRNCWQHWSDTEHGLKCRSCIAFKHQIDACFTVRESGLLGCMDCSTCRYYIETYLSRIQFVHQIQVPAAVFRDLHLWAGNALCARLCSVGLKDLVGLGIEKLVHADSLPRVIEAVRKLALGDPAFKADCRIAVANKNTGCREMRISVYPLQEPALAYLVLGMPLNKK
jgi:hypothetical protein